MISTLHIDSTIVIKVLEIFSNDPFRPTWDLILMLHENYSRLTSFERA